MVKNPPGNAGDAGSIPGLGRSPEEGHGNPQQFMPGKSYGQRSLVGYSPWGHKESDTTEAPEHSTAHTQGLLQALRLVFSFSFARADSSV